MLKEYEHAYQIGESSTYIRDHNFEHAIDITPEAAAKIICSLGEFDFNQDTQCIDVSLENIDDEFLNKRFYIIERTETKAVAVNRIDE